MLWNYLILFDFYYLIWGQGEDQTLQATLRKFDDYWAPKSDECAASSFYLRAGRGDE